MSELTDLLGENVPEEVREYIALNKAWHPIPPHPRPDSVGILLMAGDAALLSLAALLSRTDPWMNAVAVTLRERAEAAEAEVERLRWMLDETIDEYVTSWEPDAYLHHLSVAYDIDLAAREEEK